MKQVLHFLNEYDFQNFTSQLFGEELPSFQPIEGAGGDGGLDGIESATAYQMYFPEQKNRNKQKYIAKIDDSLTKLQATIASKNLSIKRWIFVVPEDLQYEVVLHLQKKSQDTGIECLYWGATKLTALVNKHPHIRNAFPGVFLPDLKRDIERVNDGIVELGQRASGPQPEISLQLNAQANSGAFTGMVSNKSGRQLVLTGVEIGGVRTEFSQPFNISCPLENLKFPAEVFDKPTSEIPVKITYRTLDDKDYELTITGIQQHRADERYNVIFPGPSAIKPSSD